MCRGTGNWKLRKITSTVETDIKWSNEKKDEKKIWRNENFWNMTRAWCTMLVAAAVATLTQCYSRTIAPHHQQPANNFLGSETLLSTILRYSWKLPLHSQPFAIQSLLLWARTPHFLRARMENERWMRLPLPSSWRRSSRLKISFSKRDERKMAQQKYN